MNIATVAFRAPTMQAIAFVLVSAVTALFTLACGTTAFHVNPTEQPAPVAVPTATAHVLRSVAFVPTRVPTPTPTTAVGPPTPTVVSRALDLESPQYDLLTALRNLNRKAISVHSTLSWPDAEGNEVLIEVKGEYRHESYGVAAPLEEYWLHKPQFILQFAELSPGAESPAGSQLEVREGIVVSNTTDRRINTYPRYSDANLLGDPDPARKQPGSAMFVSMALTGGRVIEDDLRNWPWFEAEDVVVEQSWGPYRSGTAIMAASRVNEQGDEEEWKVWLDSDARVVRVELDIASEDPERTVQAAEMEIEYLGMARTMAGILSRGDWRTITPTPFVQQPVPCCWTPPRSTP